MEARILPDGSVLTREWSPGLAATLDAWEAVILAAPPIATSTHDERENHALREEQARVTFVVQLAREIIGPPSAFVTIVTRA